MYKNKALIDREQQQKGYYMNKKKTTAQEFSITDLMDIQTACNTRTREIEKYFHSGFLREELCESEDGQKLRQNYMDEMHRMEHLEYRVTQILSNYFNKVRGFEDEDTES